MIDAIVFPGVPDNAVLEANRLEQIGSDDLARITARSKNCGGGIAPAAIGGPYRGHAMQRQRFPGAAETLRAGRKGG
jgi:hypothetical protein